MSKTKFWDKKILNWEKKNYNIGSENRRLKPNQFRLNCATDIFKGRISSKSLLDLGCGSGRLFESLIKEKPSKLIGIDFSSAAIQEASQKFRAENIIFLNDNIIEASWPKTDYVCGLGLLDWLSDEELEKLFLKLRDRDFVLTFSEKRAHISRYLHMLYIFVSYGWRDVNYVPRYYDEQKMTDLAQKYAGKKIFFFRKRKLSFGTFVSSFPI